MKTVLFVLSGHAVMGGGKPAGCYFPELVHPFYELKRNQIQVDFTTPGENGPAIVGTDFKDPMLVELLTDRRQMDQILSAPTPDKIDPEKYAGVFYTGGHGGMFDFPDNKDLIAVSEQIYRQGGLVSALCHGPAGLVNLKDQDGEFLISSKNVTGYSRDEEIFYDTLLDIPFDLGDKLSAHGGHYSCYGINQGYVQKDGRLITGQNPMSSQLIGAAIAKALLE